MTTANPQGAEKTEDPILKFLEREEATQEIEKEPETQGAEALTEELEQEASDPDQTGERGESEEPEPSDTEQEFHFQSIDELAEALEMPLDDFLGNIKGKVKVDGEESEVTLAELRNGYQREADYRRKTMELAENRKAFEAEQTQKSTQINEQLQQAGALIQHMEQQLTQEMESVDWKSLREDDPAEFTAKKIEFTERQRQLDTIKQQAIQTLSYQKQESEQKRQQQLSQYVQQEKQLLRESIPEWQDDTKANEEGMKVAKYLKTVGYTEKELSELYDHKAVVLAHKAMLYDEMTAKTATAKKKVANVPKLQKPGAPLSKGAKISALRKQKIDKLRKSGTQQDAATLIEDLL